MPSNWIAWTDHATSRLRELWAGGSSAREIAEELGISRSAVMGKIDRLGLLGRGQPIRRKERAAPKGQRRAYRQKIVEAPPSVAPPSVEDLTAPALKIVRRKKAPELSKFELRRMLTQAVQNTAAMETEIA